MDEDDVPGLEPEPEKIHGEIPPFDISKHDDIKALIKDMKVEEERPRSEKTPQDEHDWWRWEDVRNIIIGLCIEVAAGLIILYLSVKFVA